MIGMNIFISYSNENQALAKELCQVLKNGNISYWVDYENNAYGDPFAGSIVSAIDEAEVFLLLVTKESTRSKHVLRELSYADNHQKPILPVVAGEVVLSKDFEYYLSAYHLLSYSNSLEFEKHFRERIHEMLGSASKGEGFAGLKITAEAYHPQKKKALWPLFSGLAALTVAIAVVASLFFFGKEPPQKEEPSQPSQEQQESQNPLADSSLPTQKVEENAMPTQGENQLTEELRSEVEAFKYQNPMSVQLLTLRVSVGGKVAPMSATIWDGCTILSEDTSIARGNGGVVEGIAKGETHVVVVSPQGSTQVHKVIVK